jgi:hypothetical protein
MNGARLEPILRADNIEGQVQDYLELIADIAAPGELRGLALFSALKRQAIGSGPYPGVTLFEAANRIMTDLVLLYGVRWLLQQSVFPFEAYTVEFGHGNRNAFDLMAEQNGARLIGEAFNVAPSFFQSKKTAMLNKLRRQSSDAAYTVLLFNSDAVHERYAPIKDCREYHVFVEVGIGSARMVPSEARTLSPPAEAVLAP